MTISRPGDVAICTIGLAFSLLGILSGGCKDSGMSRADGALDAPLGGTATSTTTSAAGGSSFTASAGRGGTAGTGGISSSGGSGTSTSAPRKLDAGTDIKTWNKTWTTISVERKQAAGFRPPRNSAASVTIKRGQDGSLVLSGETFRAVSGDSTNCYINDGSACLEIQAFPDTTLTPAQAAELDRMVADMPPGQCTPKPNWDPSFLTRFSIDDTWDVDYGTWLCLEDYGPGTHLAAERAIVAYIDSLIPAEADAGATTDAMISKWVTIHLYRNKGLGFCPTADTALSATIKRSYDGSLTLSMEVIRVVPRETNTWCIDLLSYPSEDCFQSSTIDEIKLTPAERDRLESLVAALPPGQCTDDDDGPEPCIMTTLAIAGFSTTDIGKGCREDAGPGTHLDILRTIVSFIDSFVPPATPARTDASAGEER